MSSPVFEPTPTPQIVAEDAVSAVTDSGRDAPFEQDDRPKVGAGYIWLMVLAQFGIFLGLVAAIGYSLSVKVAQISPDNTDLLGVVVGLGATALVLVGPVLGMLSDRTRTRIGRRRPWLIAAVPLGIVGFVVVALAPSIWVMVIGWIIVQLGFGTSLAMLANSMADRLPASQRGKVAGLAGVAQMGASIIGVAVASMFTSSSLLLFLVPAGVGAVLALLFVVFIGEDDTRQLQHVESLSPRLILSKYVFDVKKYRDFSWNFLGRFLFNFGLTMSTTFTTFFFADKLGISVAEIGGIVAISGLVSIVATMGGAGFSGFLSDRLRRRRVFVFLAGILFAVGTVVMVFAPGLPVLLVGTFISSLGLGIFSAVDQALVLDVLPERDTQAGRYNAINQFSTTVPQAAAPLVAPVLLLVGGGSNYPVLFVASAVFALIGGLVILLRVKSVR
ncbi:MAG TPA: MFS transporter [Microbacterium sp.]|nr:MFS transporter [Microbacterium sp.]